MSNIKSLIDEWSVKDLEDNSVINISVFQCTELGNDAKPGLQVIYMGYTVNYDSLSLERLVYQASKTGAKEQLLEDNSWMVHEDQYVKNYLILHPSLKAKVEVKTRSSKPIIKEYDLPDF
jgi:hypothetical protein